MDWNGRKLLITGATGTLGRAFARICEQRGLPFCLTDRRELDICGARSVAAAIERHRPWAVVNTAGFVRVQDAAAERDACFAWNAEGPALLARACADAGIKLATFSSDLVFDGRKGEPYREEDEVNPLCVYGESKAEAERRVAATAPDALIVRSAAFFGPWDRYNFAWAVRTALTRGDSFEASRHSRVTPTFVPDLVHAVLDLLVDGESGIWHVANQGGLTWLDFARAVARGSGLDPRRLSAAPTAAERDTSLASGRGSLLRAFDQALASWFDEIRDAQDETLAA